MPFVPAPSQSFSSDAGDSAQQYDTVTFWQGQLAEVEATIGEMTGLADFTIGSMRFDVAGLYDRLLDQRQVCANKISFLRAGADANANFKSARARGGW